MSTIREGKEQLFGKLHQDLNKSMWWKIFNILEKLSKSVQSSQQKFKLMKLPNGIEYFGRLNRNLSIKEIVTNVSNLEDPRILASREVVKLPLKGKPSGRDWFLKLIYDRIRNKRHFNDYTTPEETK